MFEEAEEGGLFVDQIVQGGSAWHSNQIAPGDFLYEVDGVGVYRSDVDSVSLLHQTVCMCICVRVYLSVCMHVCIRTYMCASACAYISRSDAAS
jgi:hypothetical protein